MKKEKRNTGFVYQCVNCGKQFDEHEVLYLCPQCVKSNQPSEPPKGVLKIIYDYKNLNLAAPSKPVSLWKKPANTWKIYQQIKDRFVDLLPIKNMESLPNLRIGNTPLYSIDKLDNTKLPFQLFLKDDTQNPTSSLKDRASAVVSAYAKEKGFDTIITASTGNAGSSLAGICASQGQKAIIIVPETAPLAKLTQIIMYGATIVTVKGTYDDAYDLSIKATEQFGWYNRNTAFNPLTIEGKKTVAFELYEQLNFTIPDKIFVPVGDGVIISGLYKGYEDLLMLNIIEKMPIIVAVQSKGSDNLVRNLQNKLFHIEPSTTIADSISVDIPRNFFMTQHFLQTYNGESLTVSDDEILMASAILARNTGLFAEPAAAAAFAGLLFYHNSNKLPDESDNVVLITGSGLKDLKAVNTRMEIPKSIKPSIEELKKIMQ